MNTKEKFESMLVERGMFPNQAEAVMKIAMPEIDAVVPDYFVMSVKPIALKWLKENAPLAWFLPMFE